MATTSYGLNDALAVKLWSKALFYETLKATKIAPLMGTDEDSIIMRLTETEKGAGDKITFGLMMQISGRGRTENEILEGNEESLTTYSDSIYINELCHAVKVKNKGTIDVQRINFKLREKGMRALRDWSAKRMSTTFFTHMAGYTPTTDVVYTGNNSVIAPSATRQLWQGSATNDQGLTSTDIFDLSMIDYAVEMATTADPQIRPISISGEDKFVLYLHPHQVTDLRTNTTEGQWLDIQKAAMMGGKISGNPIYTGALGEYNGVIIRWSHDIPQGVNSSTGAAVSNTRRAVFLGAQSAVVAFGQDGGPSVYNWTEELFDYKRQLGIAIKNVWGLKKVQFNSTDFGCLVLSTYAAAHT